MKSDIGVAFGYAVFYIMILASDINFLELHKVVKINIGSFSFVNIIISIKAIILALHGVLYLMLYKIKGLRKKVQKYLLIWDLFMILFATHLCSI